VRVLQRSGRQRPPRPADDWERFVRAVLRVVLDGAFLAVILVVGLLIDLLIGYALPDGIRIVDAIHEGVRIIGAFGIAVLFIINVIKTIIEYLRYDGDG
jgi:hypothetical protein